MVLMVVLSGCGYFWMTGTPQPLVNVELNRLHTLCAERAKAAGQKRFELDRQLQEESDALPAEDVDWATTNCLLEARGL